MNIQQLEAKTIKSCVATSIKASAVAVSETAIGAISFAKAFGHVGKIVEINLAMEVAELEAELALTLTKQTTQEVA